MDDDKKIEVVVKTEDDCNTFVCNVKKHWLKSKTVIINGVTTVGSIVGFGALEFKDLITQNMDWLKSSGIDPKYIFLALGILGAVNIYFRFKTSQAITTKKSETENK